MDLYTHDFTAHVWHNFGVVLDFNKKYFSTYHYFQTLYLRSCELTAIIQYDASILLTGL